MADFKLMGRVIGSCEGWEAVDDDSATIQAKDFTPSREFSNIPAAAFISFHMIEGRWKTWDPESGDVGSSGWIFPTISDSKV